MTFEIISEAVQLGLPTGLIIVGVAFGIVSVWPWWVERDETERTRRDAHIRADMEQQHVMATAISMVAEHLRQPIKVEIISRSDGPVEP